MRAEIESQPYRYEVDTIGTELEDQIENSEDYPIRISARRYFKTADEWSTSIYGKWLKHFVAQSAAFEYKNIVFIDFEFSTKNGVRTPILACWEETDPPIYNRNEGHAWLRGGRGKERVSTVLERADIIVSYNLFTFDIVAMGDCGFDLQRNAPKFVDPYTFVFRNVSCHYEGNLDAVSKLNLGVGKTHGEDDEVGKRLMEYCRNDVTLVKRLFLRMMTGVIETSRFGTIDVTSLTSVGGIKTGTDFEEERRSDFGSGQVKLANEAILGGIVQ